jgi:hypothetical protein
VAVRGAGFKQIVVALLCVAVAVPAVAIAASPQSGGRYTGKSKPILGAKRHTVSIRISSDGTRGTLRYCGDRRRRAMSAGFRLRKGGRFTATKRQRRKGKRVVTFQAKGRFTSRTRVKGDIVVVFECDRIPGTFTARLRR